MLLLMIHKAKLPQFIETFISGGVWQLRTQTDGSFGTSVISFI